MRLRDLSRSLLWIPIVFAVACGEPPPPSRVHLRVVGDIDEPIAGAQVRVDGTPSGESDARGGLWLSWPSERPGRVEVTVACPTGFQSPPPRALRARHPGVRRIEMRCAPEQRHAYLAIAAPGAQGLPVTVDGEHLGEVPQTGVLHAQVLRPTGSDVRVRIDTTGRPRLRPQNPVVEARLEHDEVIVLEQRFERSRPRARRKAVRKPVAPSRPQRLRSL